ncbi:MAG: RsmE family RNA methyltransferase [Nannocystaceae bacterium]
MSLRVFASRGVEACVGARVRLAEDERHYLTRVRRARVGDEVEILDASEHRWLGRVERLTGGEAVLRIEAEIPAPEIPHIVVGFGLPQSRAALEAIARCCELGVAEILLVRTALSQAAPPNPSRVQRVLRASQRQCGRATTPHVTCLSFDASLHHRVDLAGAIASPQHEARLGLRDIDPSGHRFFVGPEGGFSAPEIRRAEAAGFVPRSLGPWTLRTEVAVVAAVSTFFALVPPRKDSCKP